VRLGKFLASAGVASRRASEELIRAGRVTVDEQVETDPARQVDGTSTVLVDGQAVRQPSQRLVYAVNKPTGVVSTARDPQGRPTVVSLVPHPPGGARLYPVGRLDIDTTGLILLTNDGELKRQLELPRTGVVRTYRARAHGPVTQAQLEQLAEGITIDGIRYGSINANLERRTGSNCWIEMSLTEGKNREVRRVLAHLGLQVSRLIRTAYGPLNLDGLAPADVDEVSESELQALRKSIK